MINKATSLISEEGHIIVSEPLLPKSLDPFIVKHFYKIDRGHSIHSSEDLKQLLTENTNAKIIAFDEYLVSPSILGWPKIARFGVFKLSADKSR